MRRRERCRVAGACAGPLGRLVEQRGLGGRELPENCVDEAAGLRSRGLAGERDAGAHCGVRRNAIEGRKLIRAETQYVLEAGSNLLPAAGNERGKERIESTLAPEDAGRQLVREPPVVAAELLHRAVERRVELAPVPDVA